MAGKLLNFHTVRLFLNSEFFFQSLLLFTNVIMDSAGIDYHVMLAGNVFQQCLDNPGLQEELLCALCKQTSRIMTQSSKHGVQVKKQPRHTRVSFFLLFLLQGDPNQNCPFLRAIALKLSTSDPMLVKPKLV